MILFVCTKNIECRKLLAYILIFCSKYKIRNIFLIIKIMLWNFIIKLFVLQLWYTFEKYLLLQEPLLVVGAFYLLFLLVIIYVRLDFSITKVKYWHIFCKFVMIYFHVLLIYYVIWNNASWLNKIKIIGSCFCIKMWPTLWYSLGLLYHIYLLWTFRNIVFTEVLEIAAVFRCLFFNQLKMLDGKPETHTV